MKKIIFFTLLTSFFILGSLQKAKATHFSGSDLTYTCLGGNTYLISFTFYRDCSGATAPSVQTVNFSCSSNPAYNFSATLNRIPGTGQEITPGCSAIPTSCANGNNYGIQEYVFQGNVTLSPCNEWTLQTSSCCRNTVTTVSGQGSWTMIAKLNNLSAPCNSSPTFSNKPVAVVCNNQSFCFNHGALDPDGDSLVYSFYAPFTTYPQSVPYVGSYSATNFLGSSTPITIDHETGDICFTPNSLLSTVTGVKVDEYRTINGVATKIGTVYRDLQMKVVQCNNTIPVLSGMDTTQSATYNPNDTTYRIELCLSQDPFEFHINGFDADTFNPGTTGSPEKFSISWNNGIPGGTFNTYNNGTASAYASFSWQPTSADIGNIKCFTATVQDEACPYNGFQTFSYCILVRGMLVDIGSDTLVCDGESFTANADADTTTVNYYWYMDGIASSNPPSQDWYLVNSSTIGVGQHILTIETNDGNTTTTCPGVDEMIIDVIYQPEINGTLLDSAFCDGGAITYDGGPGQQYTWTDIVMNPLGASKTFTTSNSGTYIVTVNGGVNTRCFDVDTFEVVSIPYPKLKDDTCIWAADAPYTIDAGFLYAGLGYRWDDGSDQRYLDVTTTGKYTVEYYHTSISSSVGCSDSQNINVINKNDMIQSVKIPVDQDSPLPGETPQPGNREICSHQRLKLTGPSAPSGYSYDYAWSNTAGGKVFSTSAAFIFHQKVESTYKIVLDAGGCLDSIDVITKPCDVKVPNIITPNGDGANDFFKIVIMDDQGKPSTEGFYLSFPNSTLLITNRWGTKIYESNNYQNDWNGNGASDGVYYWILELQDGEDTQMQGTVTIISK